MLNKDFVFNFKRQNTSIMKVFTKCCCCVDLRAGAIVIAIVDIAIGLASLVKPESGSYVGCLLLIGAGISLLIGAIKENQIATIVSLVLQMIGVVAYVIIGILLIVGGSCYVEALVFFGILFLIAASLQIYFWLCIFSFLKGLESVEVVSYA